MIQVAFGHFLRKWVVVSSLHFGKEKTYVDSYYYRLVSGWDSLTEPTHPAEMASFSFPTSPVSSSHPSPPLLRTPLPHSFSPSPFAFLPHPTLSLRHRPPFMALGGTLTSAAADDASPHDSLQSENGELPHIVVQSETCDVYWAEFMVDMKCDGCVSAVRNKLEPLEGVESVEVDLPNQVVRVRGTARLKSLNVALEQTGRKSRLIGQGALNYIPNAAVVAEFKGPVVFGVVRIVQVSIELARIEANFSGMSEGVHGWSINEYGDLTRGAASTGKIYDSPTNGMSNKPIGDLEVIVAGADGKAEYSGSKPMLTVADLPGRALVVYGSENKDEPGIVAAVIARSAGVGENYKKLCTCDGTVIWESTNNDFVKVTRENDLVNVSPGVSRY